MNVEYSVHCTVVDGVDSGEPCSVPDGDPNHVNVVVVSVTVYVVGTDSIVDVVVMYVTELACTVGCTE